MSDTAPEPGGIPAAEVFDTQSDLPAIVDVLSRSFLTAHLLTGDAAQGEMAVMQAIDSWNPGEEGEVVLFDRSLREAVEIVSHRSSSQDQNDEVESYLPKELREILTLPSVVRVPLVLRFLVGMSAQLCAEIVHPGDAEALEFSGPEDPRFHAL